jgi:hypothetical protein
MYNSFCFLLTTKFKIILTFKFRKYFIQTVQENEVQFDSIILEKAEEKDFNIAYEINEKWNQKIANEREVRLQLEKEAKKLLVLEALERKNVREEEIKLEVEKKVQELKIITSTFVTKENIDVVLNEVLNTTVDYNRALDLQGNWSIDDDYQLNRKKHLSKHNTEIV